jgi:hypothetical protein
MASHWWSHSEGAGQPVKNISASAEDKRIEEIG